MDDLDESELELLGALHATLIGLGVTVVLTESQIQKEFDKLEGEGALRGYLDSCNVNRLEDFMSNFPNKFQRVGQGKWKPVNDGSVQNILNVMAGPKKSKGGRGGSVSTRSRGGSVRGRQMGNASRIANASSSYKPMPAFGRGGYQNRQTGSYGSAFRKQLPPQENVWSSELRSDIERNHGYNRQPAGSPPRSRNDHREDSRDFDAWREAPQRWNSTKNSEFNRPFDNQRRRTPSPPRHQNYEQRSDFGGPSKYNDYRGNHYQENRNRDIDARDYDASRGYFDDSAYDNRGYGRKSPSQARRRGSPSPRRHSQRGSDWNGSPLRHERPRERTPPNHRSGSPSSRYDHPSTRYFSDRRQPSPPRESYRSSSPVRSQRSFNSRIDRSPPGVSNRGPSPVRSQRSFNSRIDRSPPGLSNRGPSPVRSQRSFNSRNDRGPPSELNRGPSPVRSQRSFNSRSDWSPPRELNRGPSPARNPGHSDEACHRSYSSQRVERSPERTQNSEDIIIYKKPERVMADMPGWTDEIVFKKSERVEQDMNEIAQSFGSVHIRSGTADTVTLDINVAEAMADVLDKASKTTSGRLDMSRIFSTFEKANNTTFPGNNYRGKMKSLHDLKFRFPDILSPLNLSEEGHETWDSSALSCFSSGPPGIAPSPGIPPPPGLAPSSFAQFPAPPGLSATRTTTPTPSSYSSRNDYAPPPVLSRPPTSYQTYSPYTDERPSDPNTDLCLMIRQKLASFTPSPFKLATVCKMLKESFGNVYSYEQVKDGLTYILFVFYKHKYIYELGGDLEYVQLANRLDFHKNAPNFFRESQVNPLLRSSDAKTVEVVPTFFNSFTKFGVQLKCEVGQFEDMDREISKIFADGASNRNYMTSLEDLRPGHACIAQKNVGGSGIEKFHRGVVIRVESDSALIHFIDVGKTESIVEGQLFIMPEMFENIPAFGISCCCDQWSTDEQKSVKRRWLSRFHSESLPDFIISFLPGRVLPPKAAPEVWTIPVEIYTTLPNGTLLNIRHDA